MRKQTIQYSSSMDVLIEIVKRLCLLERQHDMASEEFFIGTTWESCPTMRNSPNGLTIICICTGS
jgi:hypothetical protein